MGRCKDGRCHHPSSLSYPRCVDAGNSPPPLLVEHNKSIREDASNLLTHGHGRHGGGDDDDDGTGGQWEPYPAG